MLLNNFRPDASWRLGLGYEEVSRRNPRIVYVSVAATVRPAYAHRAARIS